MYNEYLNKHGKKDTKESVNFFQTELPTDRIVIGIKDGRIISMDWGYLFSKNKPEDINSNLIEYLEKAIEYLKK